ncbi:MAG: hypothetical protein PWQ79_1505 [Thermococcaceae archaeon]|nr:hypothetical protein [Thermococcaceae archaeon]MDK2914590.1 hypothetical protein [Thermococcaceae archaeon]
MRFLSYISSITVVGSFFLPWVSLKDGNYSFLKILLESIDGSLSWLNPESAGSLTTYVIFFTGVLLITLGVLFGLLGGRLGPALGITGLLIFTAISRVVYGEGFFSRLQLGYYIAFLGFMIGVILAGGENF